MHQIELFEGVRKRKRAFDMLLKPRRRAETIAKSGETIATRRALCDPS
jgi:hypothetical protein